MDQLLPRSEEEQTPSPVMRLWPATSGASVAFGDFVDMYGVHPLPPKASIHRRPLEESLGAWVFSRDDRPLALLTSLASLRRAHPSPPAGP